LAEDPSFMAIRLENSRSLSLFAFYSFGAICYGVVFVLACVHVHNAYQAIAFLSLFTCTTTYHLYALHIMCFSEDLCMHTLEYSPMNGNDSYIIPQSPRPDHRVPWKSISHVSHLRGSTSNKLHSIIVSAGSTLAIAECIFWFFEPAHSGCESHQTVAVWFLFFSSIGAFVLANIESHGSPSFSKLKNQCLVGIHTVAGLTFVFMGTLGYFIWTAGKPLSVLLFTITMIFGVIYGIGRGYQKRRNMKGVQIEDDRANMDEMAVKLDDKEDDDNGENEKLWVHRMSMFNVGTEIVSIFCTCMATNLLAYSMGDDC